MNTYKKTLLTIGLSLTAMQAYGLTSAEVHTFLAESFAPLNNVSNLFNTRTPQPIFDNLATAATILKEYITTSGQGDSDLMKAFGHVEQANNMLINAIKISYNSFLSTRHQLSDTEKNSVNSVLNNFKTIEGNMSTVINSINNVTLLLPGKRNARDLLKDFAIKLASLAKQAQTNLVEKIASVDLKYQQSLSVLGLAKGANESDIKKTYFLLARKWHPDKNTEAGAEAKFKEINAAYEYLTGK